MTRAQVWNDNVHPHTERFKDREISIPAKSFIEMDYDDAIEFKCQFTPIKTDGEKNPLPEGFKMIRVVPMAAVQAPAPLVCHATGKVASSPEELAKMEAEHLGQLDEGSKKELEASAALRRENEELKRKLADLTAAKASDKRGPGRPRKEA